MAKCVGCGKFLSKGGAPCSKCVPECKGKVPSPPVKGIGSCGKDGDTKTGDAQNNTQSPQVDIGLEIRLFRTELREVRDEFREFRREMADLHLSVAECNKRADCFESRLEALENRSIVAPSEDQIGQLQRTVERLKLELNDREQESFSSDLELANLPEVNGENPIHTVGLVAAKLGVNLDERDIVFAERVGARGGEAEAGMRCRRIVVRLTRCQLRDDLLRSARVRRGTTSAELGFAAPARRFYLNERLTRANKQLFHRAREVSRRVGWRYTWTRRGRIYVRQGDGKPVHNIRSEDDLERIFDSETVVERSN